MMASQAKAAEHLGVSTTVISELTSRGVLTRDAKRGYNLDQARLEYLRDLREKAAGRSSELNLQEERARLAKEQADAKEMENAIGRGELVKIDDIVKQFEDQLLKSKVKLLAVPTKVAAEVNAAKDVKECKAIIEEAVKEALSELVGYRQSASSEEA
jgi:phage terminase Nu1 subunit (DNA packaging protein)